MTRRRWIADEFSSSLAALTGEHAAHLARTLRARVGQEFEVACGDQVRRATVVKVADDRVEFALAEDIPPSLAKPITLVLAIFKFDRMEWAIEKCTELNVTSVIPVIAQRSEKHMAQAAEKRVERWRRIAREASEQSRRVAPPKIADPMELAEALSTEAALRIVLAENERETGLGEVLRSHTNAESFCLAVGPEGGWTDGELRNFADAKWVAASLGETILRAETAAIAALAIARAEI
jgi:16S rRNA (uracil1498-N3)-methyltransferase